MSTTGWVKKLYYYLVMLISLFFLVIGIFNIARTSYVANFAPKLLESEIRSTITSSDNPCYPQFKPVEPTGAAQEVPVDKEACQKAVDEWKPTWLQKNLLWSVLSSVLAAIVMGVHYFIIGRHLNDTSVAVNKAK